MPSLPVIPAKDVLHHLLKYGCVLISVKGSHHKIENPINGKRAPIPVHSNKDMDRSLLKSLLTELGIDVDDFLDFIS